MAAAFQRLQIPRGLTPTLTTTLKCRSRITAHPPPRPKQASFHNRRLNTRETTYAHDNNLIFTIYNIL
jgi:hypothetical protein